MKTGLSNTYQKVTDFITSKKASIFITILFLTSLLPIIYLGLHNYPTGDDFWFGVYTNRAWVETGSLLEALKGSFRMVSKMYTEWQGTWFTLFLFTLSPGIFAEHGYYITVFISLALLIGSMGYLLYYYLVQKLQLGKDIFIIILCTVLYPAIQYIPRTTSGIFWFNGIMHYYVPFLLAVIAVVNTQKFVETGKLKNYIALFLSFTLLGGGSYLMPIAASLAALLILFYQLKITGEGAKLRLQFAERNWLIFPAFITELIGLLISFLAPGNSVRGGEEFGADLKWALQCVWYAIDRGIYLGIDYFQENMVTALIYIGLAIFLWTVLWPVSRRIRFRFPLLFVVYMNGIYWAIYTPEIYARSDVSGGVPNTYFHVFLLVTLANMIYVHGWIQNKMINYWKRKSEKTALSPEQLMENSPFYGQRFKKLFAFPALTLILICLLISGNVSEKKTTNDYCMEYITSGRMEEYVKIREAQYLIMTDDSIQNAVIPELAGDQYPLCHMTLSGDPSMQHNVNQAAFYGKESVVAEMINK